MPRSQRVVIPGLTHHVTQRGNRRCNVFFDDQDRLVFLRLLGEVSKHYFLCHFGYCLMTNHLHLICVPDFEWSLSAAMRDLLSFYAIYFNTKHALKGHLWQGRFYSCPMDTPHFWTAMRYVELNPVRAGIVKSTAEYRWSSARSHCGMGEESLPLKPMPQFPPTIQDWPTWLAEEESGSFLKVFRRATLTGQPFGSEEFVKGLEVRLGRKLTARPPGRPRKTSQAPKVSLPFPGPYPDPTHGSVPAARPGARLRSTARSDPGSEATLVENRETGETTPYSHSEF